jgi:chemotaxis protein MotB
MATPIQPIIIIKKKKGGHAGHHGGAWKVAYADFVTAMMALFIVLWLMNTSQDVKKAVAGYFKDPKGSSKQAGSSVAGVGESLTLSKDQMGQLKQKLEEALKQNPEFDKLKDHVKMTVTGEGLRIELIENEKGMFFETGQPSPTESGKSLIEELARQIGKLPNGILIEGHTDSQSYTNPNYTNWELSSDRANAARRIMDTAGLRPNQVGQVRGFADQQLRLADRPQDPSNRRISIIVRYLQQAPAAEEKTEDKSPKGGKVSPPVAGEKHTAPQLGAKAPPTATAAASTTPTAKPTAISAATPGAQSATKPVGH